jgi:methionine synthase II (cobalamin-independent)
VKAVLSTGVATSIGSLPHTDPDAAATVVLDRQPDLPAAPQLPARSAREGMIAQGAHGIHGVTVLDDGALRVDGETVESGLAEGVPVDGALHVPEHGGLLRFLERIEGRHAPVKMQLTGPVTLGLALARAGVASRPAFAVAAEAVQVRARAVLDQVARHAPGAPVVVFLDEPSLAVVEHPGFPLPPHAVVDMLTAALASLNGAAATGVHCCGPTRWSLVFEARPDILSLPLALARGLEPTAVGAFLGAGGWVAWGAVPTDAPISDDVSFLWRRLLGVWGDLVRGGCPSLPLRERALVTPACGLAGHGLTQAERTLTLTAQLGERMREQATSRRLTIGA